MSNVSNNTHKLNKSLNSIDILMVAFGAMIGWGWVISSGGWIHKAGSVGTVIGFSIAGVMIYFVGLVYAELTTAMPQNGGCLLFSYKAFGKNISFVCSWMMALGYIGVVCFEACSLPTVIAYIFPDFLKGYIYTVADFDIYISWLITAIVISILITYINIKGLKTAAIMQNILTMIIAIAGVLLVVSSAINGEISNLREHIIIGESAKAQLENIFSIAIIAPFFLFGFDVIPQAAEEINVDLKKIGKILVLSIILAVSFYGLVVLAIGYAMNTNEISSAVSSNSLIAADAMGKMFKSEIMAKVLIIGGACGIVTSWNSFLIGGSRIICSMSESKMLPGLFGKIDEKHKTPVNAIVLIGGLSVIAPFFGEKMLEWMANAASFSCCVAYCIVSVSYVTLRKEYPNMVRPFVIRKWKMVGVMAVVMSLLMIIMYLMPGLECRLSKEEVIIILGWIILGYLLFALCKMKK